jgi:hypothetical protein
MRPTVPAPAQERAALRLGGDDVPQRALGLGIGRERQQRAVLDGPARAQRRPRDLRGRGPAVGELGGAERARDRHDALVGVRVRRHA